MTPFLLRHGARCLLFLTVVGCSGGRSTSAVGEAPGAPEPISLRVDDAEVGTIALRPGEPARPLTSWLSGEAADPSRWTHLQAEGTGGRRFGVRHPSVRYPDTEVRIGLDAREGYTIGVYRLAPAKGAAPARPGPARQVAGLAGIRRVEIFTHEATAVDGGVVPLASIPVQVPGRGRFALAPAQLASLPHATDPRGRSQGWLLGDVGRVALGGQSPAEVTVVMEDGSEERFSRSDLDDPARQLILKHNRDGQLRLQIFGGGAEAPANAGRPARVLKQIQGLRVVGERRGTSP